MKVKLLLLSSCVLALLLTAGASLQAQDLPNSELVGALAKELGSTPQQATGAAGALFSHAKSKLSADDWSKVASAVPGIDGLLKAAPAAATAGAPAATGTTGAIASAAAGLGDVAGAFTKLGLKPDMVAKAVPILTNYVSKAGGANVGQILAGAFK